MSAVSIRELMPEVQVKTSFDVNGALIRNSAHGLTAETLDALRARRSAHLKTLAIDQELDRTPQMRKQASALRWLATRGVHATGPDASAEIELRDAALRRSDQISTALKQRIGKRELTLAGTLPRWRDAFAIAPVDHSFWWAQTQPYLAPDMQCDFRDDGLHFWGGPKVNDYDGEMHTSFGAVASFALQPSRFPTSPAGVLLSSPHVELYGGVVAYAPDWDLIQGDGIASCQLYLRQTIFQWGFGPTGPVPLIVGDARGNDSWHIYLKNTGYSRHGDMPGFKLLPAVTYRQDQLLPQELWVEIEVRFDIYLNCTGALLWCDPDVLMRHFQWAPTPLP